MATSHIDIEARLEGVMSASPPTEEVMRHSAEAHVRERHVSMLFVAVVVLVLSVVLRVESNGEGVALAGWGTRLPELCASRAWFGVECPGCGLTRSFIALSAGEWARSLEFHRVGWLLWLAVVLQIPYRIYGLRELRNGIVGRRWPVWCGYFLLGALVGNWMLRAVGV